MCIGADRKDKLDRMLAFGGHCVVRSLAGLALRCNVFQRFLDNDTSVTGACKPGGLERDHDAADLVEPGCLRIPTWLAMMQGFFHPSRGGERSRRGGRGGIASIRARRRGGEQNWRERDVEEAIKLAQRLAEATCLSIWLGDFL